ncbi:amidophosphoribosyltransferase [Sulfuracidifex metallicus]|uniref:amidophosphoribosyltransferase n=1 Tax=Sulfuracidifex metallicus TaxID=47303 RepID=UPI0022741812|nr:amidophosphoribosyltransferase [Sulfuracidifex metallicus]MCY0849907.1 amidophosphoribosyltransferase [Sulfuracidifex metallicus]
MAGLIGLLSFDKIWNINKFLYYGLVGLQHRGYSQSGISLLSEEGIIKSMKSKVAPEDLEVGELEGWAGIGYAGTSGYPVQVDGLSVAIDGVISDQDSFVSFLQKDPKEAIRSTRFPFSFVAITKEGKLMAYRDHLGLKPLSLGGFGFDMAIVASEMTSMNVIGGEFRREIKPGELVIIDRFNVKSVQVREPEKNYCSIEYIYQARIDSFVDENDIYSLRLRIGEKLAEEFPIDADTVIGVPDTALPFAVGYSRKTGIPLDLGFTRTGSPIRTMLASDDFTKVVGIQLKLNPIKSAVFNKRMILIDDSMVTGTTLKNTVFNLRRLGAKEVHILIGSPKLSSKCPYGVAVPEEKELIAANLPDSEIAKVIGADSIHWLSLEGLYSAIGHRALCVGCMTGKYPTKW